VMPHLPALSPLARPGLEAHPALLCTTQALADLLHTYHSYILLTLYRVGMAKESFYYNTVWHLALVVRALLACE